MDNTIENEDSKNDIKENIVDNDSYDSEDCSAQEYEIMKVNFIPIIFKLLKSKFVRKNVLNVLRKRIFSEVMSI